jgi:enoyl-CoA hydratase/carnithine racemase
LPSCASRRVCKPDIAIGITPTFGGTHRLPRLAGRKRALERLLTADSFSPQRALEMGLVNRIVPFASLLDVAFALVDRITRHSQLAVARVITAATQDTSEALDA